MPVAACLAVCAALVAVAPAAAQRADPRPQRSTYAARADLEVLHVQGSVYLLAGGGSNVVFQVGEDAVFVVDTNPAALSDKVIAAIRTVTDAPIRYIVNTSADEDHVGGNEALAKADGGNVNAFLGTSARIYAHENTYSRMANPGGGATAMPVALWPTDAFTSPKKTFFVTGEPIEVIHVPSAHTDGDVLVFFRKSDVIAAGDVFLNTTYPVIDPQRGGSLAGILNALNLIVDMTIPEYNAMGGTRVIAGHGRINNEIDVVEYRDMLTIIRDRIALMVQEGRSLEDVKAAGVTLEYDGSHGATSGPWTTDMFIEAAYRELRAAAVPVAGPTRQAGRQPQAARPAAAARTAPARRRLTNDGFDGNWTMNQFESKYEPSNTMPYRREMTVEMYDGEMSHATSSWRRGLGNNSPLTRTTYTAKFDGQPYQVDASTTRVTLRRVDARTIERTATGDRGATETATWTLSADGQVLTIVTSGVDGQGARYSSTQVYDRQP